MDLEQVEKCKTSSGYEVKLTVTCYCLNPLAIIRQNIGLMTSRYTIVVKRTNICVPFCVHVDLFL